MENVIKITVIPVHSFTEAVNTFVGIGHRFLSVSYRERQETTPMWRIESDAPDFPMADPDPQPQGEGHLVLDLRS